MRPLLVVGFHSSAYPYLPFVVTTASLGLWCEVIMLTSFLCKKGAQVVLVIKSECVCVCPSLILGYYMHVIVPKLYMGAGDLNPASHTCSATTIATVISQS